MLERPLLTKEKFNAFISEVNGHKNKNLKNEFIKYRLGYHPGDVIEKEENESDERITVQHIHPININLHREIPQVLYQSVKNNPGKPDVYDFALSIKNRSFITGYQIISLLGWTEYIPKVLHINYQRASRLSKKSVINNEALQNVAFKPKRSSNAIFTIDDYQIILLSGQDVPDSHLMYLNDIIPDVFPLYARTYIQERMIIEALINYHYFGGTDIVWQAGLGLFPKLNMDKLIKVYDEMNTSYPYANAIGYWINNADVPKEYLNKWQNKINRNLKFHLFLGDSERRIWNGEWNLYVPKRFSKD